MNQAKINDHHILQRFVVKFIAFFVGATLTYTLHSFFTMQAVIASALVGLFGTLIPNNSHYNKQRTSEAIYAGSFAGMCTLEYVSNIQELLVISFIGAGFFLLAQKYFQGIGGKLGTIAFVSVTLVMLARSL